jgi:hypothetical protein
MSTSLLEKVIVHNYVCSVLPSASALPIEIRKAIGLRAAFGAVVTLSSGPNLSRSLDIVGCDGLLG